MYIKKILFVVSILIAIGLAIFSYYIYNSIFSANTDFKESTHAVYIPTGAGFSTVSDSLKPYLKDLESFQIVAQKKGYATNVRPGRYLIRKGMNNNELVNALRSGNQPVSVVFNNQERLENLAGRIAEQIEADSLSLLKAFQDEEFLKNASFDRESALGMYVPNKYELYWNTSAEEFRDRMQKEYNRFWNQERLQKAEKIGLKPSEVIALASIVQKETAKVEERPRVAGVYMNRINRGMKLDADPTVIYSIKRQQQDFDTVIKRVLYKDLEIDSPYNTYKYAGVPPGPIFMPDISSIDAVLNYEKHDFIYFVADVENFGYHKFAKTHAQHIRNKQQYVNWVNKNGIRR
ncbi:endolytic transglycosylase MltG [Christiangramia flava]|uniref:Endolytic murein transglycosylase n=1 Tax=Christiangramia flava JLT2011 TaxID=1229726 RepID=A0A1L7I0P0_9FLAO|nr:endolytic transglycosylase MltG [Christiangramia flava]APU67168.1 protein YceG like [Christiangramia flava JLT2011]OSS38060.1 protein YceG [Christiangramia flava JLT2011]